MDVCTNGNGSKPLEVAVLFAVELILWPHVVKNIGSFRSCHTHSYSVMAQYPPKNQSYGREASPATLPVSKDRIWPTH